MSNLTTFFTSLSDSDTDSSSAHDDEVSFTVNQQESLNDSVDECFHNIRKSLTFDAHCCECKKAIFFAKYLSCSGCCNLIHPQCLPPPQTPLDDLSPIPGYEPTLCSACRRVNKPTPTRPHLSQANCWGDLNAEEVFNALNLIAPAISTWSPNLFQVPFGAIGRSFIDELTRLANLFATSTAAEPYALSALVLAPALLLQKPNKKSKATEHKTLLEQRLKLWKEGNFEKLFREGSAIQKPLKFRSPSKELCEDRFVDLMRKGQTTEATGWLDPSRHTCGVKDCTDQVLQDLEEKHPAAGFVNSKHVHDTDGPGEIQPVLFQSITGEMIYKCGLKIKGSGGPSGFDSTGVSRILCSKKYKKSSEGLCDALSLVAQKLATVEVHGDFLAIYRAARLIPLEKPDGGTRPIGIGEVFRRVITKAIIFSQRGAIKTAAGAVQLAAGQTGGCEAAIHAL